jgi:3-oxoacyl-[acyl-carrier-protein] synthase-3
VTDPVGFLGFGCALPEAIRTNDDPLFARLREEGRVTSVAARMFEAVRERRIIAPDERVEDLMVRAGQRALAAAGRAPADVDRLYGYATIPEYVLPNGLFAVHRGLGLTSRAMVLPIDNAFTTFLTASVLAWEAIRAGHARCALVDVGSNWSRHVPATSQHVVVVGDGAGAAVLGPSDRLVLLDYAEETFTDDDDYHGMTVDFRAGGPAPMYEIHEGGVRSFHAHGLVDPPRLARRLLDRHGIAPNEVALVSHQGSRRLMDHWADALRPKQYLHTLDQFGDMGLASIPVTLATCLDAVTAAYIVLIAPGPGAHFAALLMQVKV